MNLYLDREITPADADRLEKEIWSNAGRHRTYLQYCQMQQAVRVLGRSEGVLEGHCSPAVSDSEPVVIRNRSGSRWVWIGAVAAAAVLVLAFAVRWVESGRTSAEDRLAAGTVRQDTVARGQGPSLSLSGDALLLSTFPASGSSPKVHEDQFNWLRQFQLISLESRLGVQPFSPAAVGPHPATTAPPHRRAGEDASETAAFKFVK
ncbi:MAG: hypothetical protein FJ397_01800 [Verrucomicrobia bacterium]|nr:hypothetical protein [Verrucomicrobiota bacterium]